MRERLGQSMPSSPTLLAFAVSRVLVFLTAAVAETLLERNPRLTSGTGGPLLSSLTAWDGWWYLGIARDGYQAAPLAGEGSNIAFWPLYPLVVRLLSLPWPAADSVVAVLLSNIAFLFALGLVERLGAGVVGEARAVRGAALLAISPFGFVFSMAYPESLFLLLSVAACLAAERGRWPLAGVLLGLATLARFQGLVLLPTLVWIGISRLEPRQRPSLAWLGLAGIAAVAYLAFTAVLTGRPDGYLEAQAAWGRAGLGSATEAGSLAANLDWIRGAQLATFLAGVYLLVFVRVDHLPWAYAAWPIAALGLVFASGNLESVGRYLTVVVPYFWLLAGRCSRLARIGWPLLSLGLLVAISLLVFAGRYVP